LLRKHHDAAELALTPLPLEATLCNHKVELPAFVSLTSKK